VLYVTHDQVEALTFADQIVVMSSGRAVQMGSADALFEKPQHMFVGNFIGSPGMNFLPCRRRGAVLEVAGQALTLPSAAQLPSASDFTLGLRPEYVALAEAGTAGALPAMVQRVQDIGTFWLLSARIGAAELKLRLPAQAQPAAAGETVWLQLLGGHSCFYGADQRLIEATELGL
jgi:glycerol transport system ATP-binding protein